MVNGLIVTRPGQHTKNELERSTTFHGKIHYFYGDFPESYFDIIMLYKLPEGKI